MPCKFPIFTRVNVNKTRLSHVLLPFCHSSFSLSHRRPLSMASATQPSTQVIIFNQASFLDNKKKVCALFNNLSDWLWKFVWDIAIAFVKLIY